TPVANATLRRVSRCAFRLDSFGRALLAENVARGSQSWRVAHLAGARRQRRRTGDPAPCRAGNAALCRREPARKGGRNMTEDVVAIQQLLHRYCFLVDSGPPDEVATLFHETATLVPVYSGGPACKGRAAVREWYAAYDRDFRSTVEHLRHCVTNPLIEVQGDEATA